MIGQKVILATIQQLPCQKAEITEYQGLFDEQRAQRNDISRHFMALTRQTGANEA